jgi:hypothetical protein
MSSLQDDKETWGMSRSWLFGRRAFLRGKEHDDDDKVQVCLRKSDGILEHEIIKKADAKVCSPSEGQERRLQQIGCMERSESHYREVQGYRTIVKNGVDEVADEDKEEEARFDEESMILIGTILCPLEIGQKFFTRTTKKEKTGKVVTKRKVQGQEGWKIDDDKLLTGAKVSKNQVSEYEDSIRMKSHVKTSSNMCIGAAYTSMKILLCFLLLSLFVL